MKRALVDVAHRALFSAYGRRRLLVLAYHGVRPDGPIDGSLNLQGKHIAASCFREQMQFLKRRGYRFVDQDILRAAIDGGRLPTTPCVIVTFDDGYRNNYTHALPILQELQIPGFFYVVSGCVDTSDYQWMDKLEQSLMRTTVTVTRLRVGDASVTLALHDRDSRRKAEATVRKFCKRLPAVNRCEVLDDVLAQCGYSADMMPALYRSLSWAEIADMHRAGFAFGAHTLTHTILSTLDDTAADLEIRKSKRLLENCLGAVCDTFSYPNGRIGDFTEASKRILARNGIRCAFASIEGLQPTRFDPYEIRRIAVNDFMDLEDFKLRITGALGLLKSARRTMFRAVNRNEWATNATRTADC